MKRSAALLVAVVAATAAIVAFVGPCDSPLATTDAPRAAPAVAPAAAAVATAPTRIRKKAPKAGASETSDDDEATFELRIRVIDERTKAPIANAEIRSEGSRHAVTGADGEAVLDQLPRGRVRIEVRARGFICQRFEPSMPQPPDVVELAAGVVVDVEVVDAATDRPVPGANVTFQPNNEWQRQEVVVADDAGRAEANVPAGVAIPVRTRARGHVESLDFVRTAAIDAPQPTLRVRLAPAAALRGVVRGPDGRPVEGAKVRVDRTDIDGELWSAETAADGAYEVDGLMVGASYAARASCPTDNPSEWCKSADVGVTVGRGGAAVDLRLRKCGTLDVAVVDDDGAPVEHVNTKLSGEDTESSSTGGSGTFAELLTPGRYALKVWIDDRVPVAETIDIAEGATVKRRIVLASGELVEGVVVDATGEPVVGAFVGPSAGAIEAAATSAWDRTGVDGDFTVRHLVKGAHDLAVDAPYEFETLVVRGVAAPSEHARFVVTRRGTLALHVVLEGDARPAPSARIAFHGDVDGDPWNIDRLLPNDGRIEIAWPAGVRGEIGIAVDGFLPATRAVTVPAGASVDLGEVRLRRGASLVGVVRAPDGGPLSVSGLTLVVRGMWRGGECRTDESGRFAFDGLAAGRARIDVKSFAGSFAVDVPSREPLVLKLPRTGLLMVSLVDAAGAPVAGRRLVVRDADGDSLGDVVTDIGGEWGRALTPGKYSVEVEHGPRADVEVRSNDVSFVKLR